jgi:hypothetical protein
MMAEIDRKAALIRSFKYSVNVPNEEESERVWECVQMLARELSFDEVEVAVVLANVEIELGLE